MFRRLFLLILMSFVVCGAFADTRMGIEGAIEWDTLQMRAAISLDLAAAGIRLPAGRTQGEALLSSGYLNLIRPGLLGLQVDSSTTILDLINSGDFTLLEVENLAISAEAVPPSLSPDLRKITASYTMPLSRISSSLLRHNKAAPVMRTLNPVSTIQYTGIIIIAGEELPMHGMKSSALAIPCLFPKIWDSDMNLVFERNMLENKEVTMVNYAPPQAIFQRNPSGLSPELTAVVGDRPLRIFARGVFGVKPTDLIIERSDALLIISSQENRRLLSEGKVAFILDESVLKSEF
jgi:hypothetical protein